MGFDLGTIAGKIIIDGSQAKSGFGVAQAAANAFYGAVTEKLDSVRELGTRLVQVGTSGSVGLGVAIHAAADFEQTLSGVKAVSGATTQEMDALRAMALRIGKDTSFSAGEAAQAIQELSKAGVSTKDILTGAADATVNLAAAGEIDLPRAAEIASSAMNNFAIKGSELPHVADLIAGAANASAIDVGDFGFSLTQAGAVAHLTGLSFDDLAVAIAEMGKAGIKGSDAGTSIKTFLTNLIPTTNKQIGLFQELGLEMVNTGGDFRKLAPYIQGQKRDVTQVTGALQEYIADHHGAALGTAKNAAQAQKLGVQLGVMRNAFFDANGNMEKFSVVQERLKEATKNLSKEQKLEALNTLFGSDAIRASAVFADNGAAGFDKLSKAMGGITAASVAKTRLDNLNGSMENLKGSLETAEITIGEVFLPTVRKIVDTINSVINIFNNLPPSVQRVIAIFIGLGSVFSLATGLAIKLAFVLVPMLARFLGFRALKSVFGIFFEGFKIWRSGAGIAAVLTGSIGSATAVFARFAAIGRTLFTVLSAFPRLLAVLRTASTLAFGPWGIAALAVAAALFILFKRFKPFHDLVIRVATAIKGTLVKALDELKLGFNAMIHSFKEGDITSDGFVGKMEAIGSAAHVFVGKLLELVDLFKVKVIPALKEAGREIVAQLQPAFREISKTFQQDVKPALHDIGDSLSELGPPLHDLWVAIQPVVKVLAKDLLLALGAVFIVFLKFATIMIGTVIPIMIKVGTVVIIAVIIAITKLVDVILIVTGALATFIEFIITHFVPAMEAIKNAFATVFNFIAGITSSVFNGAVNAVTFFLNSIVSFIKAISAPIIAAWTAIWTVFGPIVKDILTIISLVIQIAFALYELVVVTAAVVIIAAWKALWNGILVVVQTVIGILTPIITAGVNAVVAVMTVAWNVLKALTALTWTAIQIAITTVWAVLGPVVKLAVAGIVAAITTAWTILKTITTAAWSLIKTYIVTPLGQVVAFITTAMNTAKNVVNAAWAFLKSVTLAAFNVLVSTITGRTNAAMSPLAGIKGRIIGFFSGAGGWLLAAGRAIMQGLLDGLNAMIGKLQSALSKITSLIPKSKGPIEKDRILLTENGRVIMQSLIDGFKSQIPAINSALQSLTATIPQNVSVNQTVQSANPTPVQRATTAAQGVVVNNNWQVYNPIAEATSVTTTKAATRRAQLGVLG